MLGVTTKPFKAKHKRRNEQLLADQRRAKFSMGSDRMHKLENIYIKHAFHSATKNNNSTLPPKSGQPRADSITIEAAAVMMRHRGRGPEGLGLYSNSALSRAGLRRAKGPNLHKQNFVEDGQNIVAGQLFMGNQNASDAMPRVKKQLWQPKHQLSNSGSESTDLR